MLNELQREWLHRCESIAQATPREWGLLDERYYKAGCMLIDNAASQAYMVDAMLARRIALDGATTRLDKIAVLLKIAQTVDPKAELANAITELNKQDRKLRRAERLEHNNTICLLNLDSPSYPPEEDEFRQCGCRSCIKELESRAVLKALAEKF